LSTGVTTNFAVVDVELVLVVLVVAVMAAFVVVVVVVVVTVVGFDVVAVAPFGNKREVKQSQHNGGLHEPLSGDGDVAGLNSVFSEVCMRSRYLRTKLKVYCLAFLSSSCCFDFLEDRDDFSPWSDK